MPNEMSIQGLSPLSPAGDQAPEQKGGESFPTPAAAAPAATPALFVNPSLRLDAALGLVVIEFRNNAGAVTSSIPSQRQLQAYRQHQQAPPGLPRAPPAGAPPAGASPAGAPPAGAPGHALPPGAAAHAADLAIAGPAKVEEPHAENPSPHAAVTVAAAVPKT